MRIVKTQEAILDILDYVPNGTFMTMGYVTPVTSFKFPKKPNGRNNDYDKFYENIGALIDTNEPICGIIKIKKYNFQFFDRNYMGKHYGNFRPELEKRYGEQGKTIDSPKAPKKTPIDFGKGIDRTSLDNLMSAQNVYSAKTVSKYYPVLTNGNIGNEIDKELLKDLWAERTVPQTVKAQIRAALEDEMKYRYQNFKLDSILYIATTLNKEKILYINENVVLSVGHSKNAMININSSSLIPFAKNEYSITEAELRLKTYIKNLINETVLEMRNGKQLQF